MARTIFGQNPFARETIDHVKRDVRRFVDEAAQAGERLAAWAPNLSRWPRVEVSETRQALLVSAELPGLKPSDFLVELEGSTLVISGERPRPVLLNDEPQVKLGERRYGPFRREIALSFLPAVDDVSARFERGVLNVEVLRRLPPRYIVPVQVDDGEAESVATRAATATSAGTPPPADGTVR